MGRYLSALATGILGHHGSPSLEHFVQVARGKAKAKNESESAWLKFADDYPAIAKTSLPVQEGK